MAHTNSDYYRELAAFTVTSQLVRPVHLAVRNGGRTTAHDVRLEIVVPGVGDGITVIDDYNFPSVPRPAFDVSASRIASPRREKDVTAERVQDTWVIQARSDKVQPEATVWFRDPVYVGARKSMRAVFQVTVFADNLPTPHRQSLQVDVTAVSETANLDRILALEAERFTSSPGHQKFLRDHGLLDATDVDLPP
jgi:hypothetical protein